MIEMVEARDIEKGDTISTDGMVVTEVEYQGFSNKYRIAGVSHGVFKERWFNANDELPVYYNDREA